MWLGGRVQLQLEIPVLRQQVSVIGSIGRQGLNRVQHTCPNPPEKSREFCTKKINNTLPYQILSLMAEGVGFEPTVPR
jgi:hypothetical protein